MLLVGLTGACAPEANQPPAVQGRAVATYNAPSVYRVGPSKLRQLTDQMDPDSPQRAMLADGQVSKAEVDAAWEGYVRCMRAVGFPVSTAVWDPVTNTTRIFTYARSNTPTAVADPTTSAKEATTPPTTVPRSMPTTSPPTGPAPGPTVMPTIDSMTDDEVGRVDACEERYWFPVSAVYAADTRPHMDARLASVLVGCMIAKGYPAKGATDFGALVGAVGGRARGERVQAGRDCLGQALPDLYPDLPYFPRP